MAKAIVVAGTQSGSGKTLVTMGIIRALRNAGKRVRAAKVGPDYIDPGFHTAASGALCFNLDLWAMGREGCHSLLAELGRDSDIVVIEGVMGLFDGPQGTAGSTADLAAILGLPVLLVIDSSHQAQSVAALAHGFATYRKDVAVAGLILNRVRSDRHETLLREALGQVVPVLASLRQSDSSHIPSRHLGLIQAQENQGLESLIESAAAGVARETFLDKLFQIGAPVTNQSLMTLVPPPAQRIAVANDVAFGFVYPHLMAGWHKQGAEVSSFSPLNDEGPRTDAEFLFLPGGYPELHAGRLSKNRAFMDGLKSFKGHIYGECGGYMVLGESLTDAQGQHHAMSGLLPVATSFQDRRLHLGYRELSGINGPLPNSARGHEFHYSTFKLTGQAESFCSARTAAGEILPDMGLRRDRVMGSYAHIIAGSAP